MDFLDKTVRGKSPERSCAVCRTKSLKGSLFRFVYSPDGSVVCDIRQKLQSRGVYICKKKECIKNALKKKVFSRFFKHDNIEPSLNELTDGIYKGLEGYLFNLMKLAVKSGRLKIGSAAVFDAAQKGRVRLFIVCNDAGQSVKEKIEYLNNELSADTIFISDKLTVAEKLDIAVVAVTAVTDEGFSRSLKDGWEILTDVKTWYDGECKWQ